jgi:hypothetical protein
MPFELFFNSSIEREGNFINYGHILGKVDGED